MIIEEIPIIGKTYHGFDGTRGCRATEIVSEQTPSGAVNQYLGRQSSFVPGDPYATAFNEGRREVVLYLKTLMEMSE